MLVTNRDGGDTVNKNSINKKTLDFCVSSDRSRISWQMSKTIDTIMSPGPFVGFLLVVIHCKKRKPHNSVSKLIQFHPDFLENQFALKGYHK